MERRSNQWIYMKHQIRIDLAAIAHFYQDDQKLERKVQILARKNAIYNYRNQLLSQQLNETITNDDFAKTEYGKPFLKTEISIIDSLKTGSLKTDSFEIDNLNTYHLKDSTNLFLNHSHSQHFYVLATSNSISDLGVDIEELKRKVRFDALAKHAFHPTEYEIWIDLECDPNYWFRVWTTKEAILKASGLGIRMSMNEINTNLHPMHRSGCFEHDSLGCFLYYNYCIQGCILTVAWRVDQFSPDQAKTQIEMIEH